MPFQTYSPKVEVNDLANAVNEGNLIELAKLLMTYHELWTDPGNLMPSAKKYAKDFFYRINEPAITAVKELTTAKTDLNNQKNIGPFHPSILKRKSVDLADQYPESVYKPFMEKIKVATLTLMDVETFVDSAKLLFGEFDQNQKKAIGGLMAAVSSMIAAKQQIANLKADDIDAQDIHDTYQALVSSNSSTGSSREERIQKAQRGKSSQERAQIHYSEIYKEEIDKGNILLLFEVSLNIPSIKGQRGLKGEFDLLVLEKSDDGHFVVKEIVEVKSSPDFISLSYDMRCLKKSLKLVGDIQASLAVERVSVKARSEQNQLSSQTSTQATMLASLSPGAFSHAKVSYYVVHDQSDPGEQISYALLPYEQVMSLLSGSLALCSILADKKRSLEERVDAISNALNTKDARTQRTLFDILRNNVRYTQELVSRIIIANEQVHPADGSVAGELDKKPDIQAEKAGGGAPASASSSGLFARTTEASASSAGAAAAAAPAPAPGSL